MKINDFKIEDYIVINDISKIPIGTTSSVEKFFKDAEEGDITVEGDLFCYIPDFNMEECQLIKENVPESKWFAFKKSEVPDWFKLDEAVIVDDGSGFLDKAREVSNSEDFAANEDDSKKDEYISEIASDEEAPGAKETVFVEGIKSLLKNSQENSMESGRKEAVVYVFGSSKGGTGKTFTCLITAYHYAKTHPGEKIAVADFDIIDGQVGISIQKIQPTMLSYWRAWQTGDSSFKTMKENSLKYEKFPSNVDFYLAPKDFYINDKKFWLDILTNLVANYDAVFFDTGIDYINYPPISFSYKVADRVVLISTTSIKSVSSVLKQISKLKGITSSADANGNEVFTKNDNMAPKLRLAITGCDKEERMNNMVLDVFQKNIKINAVFGQISSTIAEAEYYGQWNIFDDNVKFNKALDRLIDLKD